MWYINNYKKIFPSFNSLIILLIWLANLFFAYLIIFFPKNISYSIRTFIEKKDSAPWGDRTLDHQLKRLALYRWANEATWYYFHFRNFKWFLFSLLLFLDASLIFPILLSYIISFSFFFSFIYLLMNFIISYFFYLSIFFIIFNFLFLTIIFLLFF